MNWQEYVGSEEKTKVDLRLLHYIESHNKDVMMKDRFRWFHSMIGNPDQVFKIWSNVEDNYLDERLSFDGSLEGFHKCSKTFPFLLAKTEIDLTQYYIDLYYCLRHIKPVVSDILIIGPTFGGEVEAAYYVGIESWVETLPKAKWSIVAEERLKYDDVIYNIWNKKSKKKEFSTIIISPWVPNPAKAVRMAYDTLGDCGFILSQDRAKNIIAEIENLGMVRKFGRFPKLGAFIKNPMTEGS